MKIIQVNTSSPCSVVVGTGLLRQTGERIRALLPSADTAVLITDDTVDGIWGDTVRKSIRDAGLQALTFVLPHGEASKNAENYLRILNFMAEAHVTRSDMIAALGGGVVGDLAGFAAATYLRGIPFIQIPTTLLAQVDSSVGGKTAIDLPAGKNLAGAFWQPGLTLCDMDTLSSLPEDVFADGCAEVIKYGVLWDAVLFAHLREKGMGFDREYAVTRSIEMKRDVVERDEFDRGPRQLLNLGHTLAHAAEQLSDYRLSHGRAVAMGMAVMAAAAAAEGSAGPDVPLEIEDTLRRFGLPVRSEYTADELYQALLSDKKRRGSTINLILPERIGACCIRPSTLAQTRSLIASGIAYQQRSGS